ncbi:hypothetical protein [Janibacter sp. GXQ6167]|uniref:hypothetical protein n=1 Tax=Janibacter sp. GXQ6167 TaxID=3240791 RepID=UPI0035266ED9
MTRFTDLPEVDPQHIRERMMPARASRRGLIRGVLGAGAVAALGGLSLVNSSSEKAYAAYFEDWTNTKTGPCAPGGYASGHTERGWKCGPSTPCYNLSCCWRYRSGAGNRVGWHKQGPGLKGYFLHRPDACWAGKYDSWHWRFSDGKTYRCSDGWTCSSSGSCFRSICPWAV